MWSYLTPDPSSKVKQGYSRLEVLINHLLLVLVVLDVTDPAANCVLGSSKCSQILTLDPSFKVKLKNCLLLL